MVQSVRSGRKSLFELDPEPIEEIRKYPERVSGRSDQALGRLKSLAEGK